MDRDLQIGDSVYLKESVRGYRCVEIIGFEDSCIIVQTTSGYEFSIYEDELEEGD